MSTTCTDKSNCENLYKDKIAILDSSVLFHLLDAVVNSIPDNTPEDQRFPSFHWKCNQLLSKIRLCPLGAKLNVTQEVFESEMNPLDPNSSIRSKASFVEICDNNEENYSLIYKTLLTTLELGNLHSHDAAIRVLRRLSSSGPNQIYSLPSGNDFGLLALSFSLSRNEETVILTDDTNLQKALENICSRRHIALFSESLDTAKVYSTSSLSYLEHIYGCCKIMNSDYFSLIRIVSDFIDELEAAQNPKSLAYKQDLDLVLRHVAEFNK